MRLARGWPPEAAEQSGPISREKEEGQRKTKKAGVQGRMAMMHPPSVGGLNRGLQGKEPLEGVTVPGMGKSDRRTVDARESPTAMGRPCMSLADLGCESRVRSIGKRSSGGLICRCGARGREQGSFLHCELELELIQPHMAQKPVLRGEVGCACVAREVSVERP